MIRHIVAWAHQKGFSAEENQHNAQKVKETLESLNGQIEGIVELEVLIDPLDTSDKSVMLISLFESQAALAAYQVHPAHVKAAGYVKSVMDERICLDFDLG